MTSDDPHLAETLLLLDRARAGDAAALDRLVGRYYGRVLRIVRLRIGPALRAFLESGDILHETFVEVLAGLGHFDGRHEASLIHWMARIAESRIRKAVRGLHAAKRDVRRQLAFDDVGASDDGAWEPAGDERSAVARLSDAEWIGILEDCIHELPEAQRDAVLLRNYAEADWSTVADELGLSSPDAARMLHKRAMAALVERARRRGVGE